MSGIERGSHGTGSNVRRRLSGSPDEDASGERWQQGGRVGVHRRSLQDERSVTEVYTDGSAISHGVGSGTASSSSPTSPRQATRVRFPADIERDPASRESALSTSRDSAHDGGWRATAPSKKLAGPSLSLLTGPGVMEPQNVGTTVTRSPLNINPTATLVGTTVTPPVSPRYRNRGYSLRRNIFFRNIHESADAEGSAIELDEAKSRGHPHGVQIRAEPMMVSSSDTQGSDKRMGRQRKAGEDIYELPYNNTLFKKRIYNDERRWKLRRLIHKIRDFLLRRKEIPPSKDGRHIILDASRQQHLTDERTGKSYIGNSIRSTRYSLWSFLPRQLFAQFSKLANFYFLCISILQLIPGLSTTGTFTTFAPLMFFVFLSIAKEGIDDLRRYKLDQAENDRDTFVLRPNGASHGRSLNKGDRTDALEGAFTWDLIKWRELQVGDIVKLSRNDHIPADLVLLHSRDTNGIAYIETMALDGETNLKSKQTANNVTRSCDTLERISACRAHFVVEDPNLDLYNFEGRVTVDDETSPLTNSAIIYRGSMLRNTPEAIGMVIYSGEECKIRMNANKNPRIKAPALQAMINKVVIITVVLVLTLATVCTLAHHFWWSSTGSEAPYLIDARVPVFPVFTAFVIMLNTMIPLSLYVSLEIVKLAQMFLLNDIDMYDEASDTPFEARTSTINEELGQVSYIFSDKTGTLTDNSMNFRKMSVAGTAWLHDLDLQNDDTGRQQLLHKKRGKEKKATRKSRGSLTQPTSPWRPSAREELNLESPFEDVARASGTDGGPNWHQPAPYESSQPEPRTHEMIRYIQRRPHTLFAKKATIFLLSIALCHTCLPEVLDDGEIDFQASSPDELALVRAAKELGYFVINRDVGTITLKSFGTADPLVEVYEVLDIIEFSSQRKRMSAIIRFPDKRICVICKGADSVVMQRLRLDALANETVTRIERRAKQRKSVEVQRAHKRKSEQLEFRNSLSRPSSLIHRRSSAAISVRPRLSGEKRLSTRSDDGWLRVKDGHVHTPPPEEDSHYQSPRPSAHPERFSAALSDGRASMQVVDVDDLIDESLVADEAALFERCFQHINNFATEGLRTLLYGYRFIDEEEYTAWKKIYHDATTSLVDRKTLIEKAGELIERDLELSGATAIEDKLQKGVPEAIDKLRRANIKMWMLTGDKRETAINIGHSCRLIKDYSSVTVLDHEAGELDQQIAAAMVDINSDNAAHSVVVIDGQTLAKVLEENALNTLFFNLAILADSVVCCRASPSQKAGLVKAIRKRVRNSVTLAVGDGANDVAMIQEAHVGIGIMGKEGSQAARTSDYSIAQFRFLLKLLLVHGRWNYIRTCKYTVGTFWKEMLFYLTQVWFQRWTGFTGTSLYESWSLSMFNTLFTSLPVIFIGIFEKDLAAATLLAVPELYTKGQRNGGFNFKIYFGWMLMAAAQSVFLFFIMLRFYGEVSFTLDNGLYAMGTMTFSAAVILISTKMQVVEMHNKSIVAAISLFCSIGGWWLWNLVLSATYTNNVIYNVRDGFLDRFGRNILWWLTLLFIVLTCNVFEFAVASIRGAFWPTDVDIFQEYEQDRAIRKRFEEAAAMELQQGWDRGKKKSSFELEREAQEQARRESEVQAILRNRPD